jgi:hypothetical protein
LLVKTRRSIEWLARRHPAPALRSHTAARLDRPARSGCSASGQPIVCKCLLFVVVVEVKHFEVYWTVLVR